MNAFKVNEDPEVYHMSKCKQKGSTHVVLVIAAALLIGGSLVFVFVRSLNSSQPMRADQTASISSVKTLIKKDTDGFNLRTNDTDQEITNLERSQLDDSLYVVVHEEVGDVLEGAIYRIDSDGNHLLILDSESPGVSAMERGEYRTTVFSDLFVNEQDEVFIAQNNGDKGYILKVDSGSKTATSVYENEGEIDAFAISGNTLFIQSSRSLKIVDLDSGQSKEIDSETVTGLNVRQLVSGPEGSVYALSESSRYVVRIDKDGSVKKIAGGSKLYDKDAACVIECLDNVTNMSGDGNGNLYMLRPAAYAVAKQGSAKGFGGGLVMYDAKSSEIKNIQFEGEAGIVMSNAGISLATVSGDGRSFFVVDNSVGALYVFSE